MKSYLSLIPISSKVRKKQNRMTILCIVLAVYLVTAVFSMADRGVKMEETRMLQKHGNWHIRVRGLTETEAAELAARPDVAAASWYEVLNYKIDQDYDISGKKAAFCGVEKAFVTDMFSNLTAGRFPEGAQEILLTTNAEEVLGIQLGDAVTVHTPAGDVSYTVSGFLYYDGAELYDAVIAFMDRTAFKELCTLNQAENTEPEYYLQFGKHVNAQKVIADIREKYGLAEESISENAAVLGLLGLSSNTYIQQFYIVAVFLFLLVLLAGVLMISSSLNSNIARRTEFFGMLRCIGATKKQVIRFVRMEALNWCRTAIPAGILLGTVTTWVICAVLRFFVRGEFAEIQILGFSMVGIISGVLVGLITVLIAAQAPAKKAARVSPVTAASGNGESGRHVRRGIRMGFVRVDTSLGVHHAAASKRTLLLMTASFAVSIVMFMAFSALLGFVKACLPALRSYTPDVAFVNSDGGCTISPQLLETVKGMEGTEQVYGNMFSLHMPAFVNGNPGEIDLISYEETMLDWSKSCLLEGDLSKISGDSPYVMTIYNSDSLLKLGDRIQIGGQELEVAAVVTDGIWMDGTATVICSEETFVRLTGTQAYTLVNVKLKKDAAQEQVAALRALAEEDILFSDYRDLNRQSNSTYWIFNLLVYGFLAIVALISTINIINSISMSVSARLRQYGAMRAIGMSLGQLTRMILSEAITYAALGGAAGCAIGLPVNKFLYESLVTDHYGTPWELPIASLLVILGILFAATVLAVYAPVKQVRTMAITEVINEL